MTPSETRSATVDSILIRHCESHEDLKLCVDLQRRVWGYDDEDVVPAAMFVVAQHTGGHALCAFDGTAPIGFALAYSGEHHGRRYWHSHMVAVLPEYQNQGVGRLLKLRQREEARKAGVASIEWTFDPLELRNAHFNIARLGAIVRSYIPNCYGQTTSPLHGGLPTDRLVAEWIVDSPRVDAAVAGNQPPPDGLEVAEIPVPANIATLKTSDPSAAREIQDELRGWLTHLFGRGYAITGFRRGDERSYYLLESYED